MDTDTPALDAPDDALVARLQAEADLEPRDFGRHHALYDPDKGQSGVAHPAEARAVIPGRERG